MTDNNGCEQALQTETQLVACVQNCLKCWSKRVQPTARQIVAWDRFYRSYSPLVRSVAAGWQLPKADEDDCYQEIWQKLVEILPLLKFDEQRGSLAGWLSVVAFRLSRAFLQKHRRQQKKFVVNGWMTLSCFRLNGPAETLQRRENIQLVTEILNELSLRTSSSSYQVFHMRWIKEQSFEEIANRLSLTPDQVRWRHHRVKQKVQELLVRARQSEEGLKSDPRQPVEQRAGEAPAGRHRRFDL